MVDVTMSMEEYLALVNQINGQLMNTTTDPVMEVEEKPKRKRSSAYARRYKAAFKRLAPKYKLKNGRWKKGGFRTTVRLAHKEARK